LVEKVDKALAALPERQRTAILLLRESKISYEDIAGVLGTTIPATKSLIHNGRNRLKRILRPYIRSGLSMAQDAKGNEELGRLPLGEAARM
jgi:RNA polymerase sigma-70 factor (ECF subfamily)